MSAPLNAFVEAANRSIMVKVEKLTVKSGKEESQVQKSMRCSPMMTNEHIL